MALIGELAHGNQNIRFRKISCRTTARDAVGNNREVTRDPLFAFEVANQIDRLAGLEPGDT